MKKAYLYLANGQVLEGQSFGASGTAIGEVVFTTGMTGCVESLTDPSYYGQLVVYTFPQFGNYGICRKDMESPHCQMGGVVVREYCQEPSNFRCDATVDTFLKEQNVVGIAGVDTRMLTQMIRDGGVMNLEDLIALSKDKVRESMPKPEETDGYDAAYIENLVGEIAIGAIKFQDLKNTISAGYVFGLEDFAKFEGKTGPYIQYAIARINSILRKAKEKGKEPGNIVITNAEERVLALKLAQLNNVIMRAEADKEPSIISDYAYTLAQTFSSFYNASPIMSEENAAVAAGRLKLAKLTRDILTLLLYLLGIKAPEVMLKAG